MSTKELFDFLIKTQSHISFLWNFYVGLLIVLIGWLITTRRPLTTQVKFLITGGYLIFVMMNIVGLIRAYRIAEAARNDLEGLLSKTDILPELTNQIINGSYSNQAFWTIVIHTMMGIIMMTVLWMFNFDKTQE